MLHFLKQESLGADRFPSLLLELGGCAHRVQSAPPSTHRKVISGSPPLRRALATSLFSPFIVLVRGTDLASRLAVLLTS